MYLAIDIGGSFIKYAKMAPANQQFFEEGKLETPKEGLSFFYNKISEVVDSCSCNNLEGIGISSLGIVDKVTGRIFCEGPMDFLNDGNLKKYLENKYEVPVFVENDGNSAALAELWLGNCSDVKNAVLLVLGSGIGGGIIINGNIYRGFSDSAGEFGYLVEKNTYDGFKKNYLGYFGSAVQLLRHVCELNKLDIKTNGQEVFKYISKKNVATWKIFEAFCKEIAFGIVNLQLVLDVEKFVIGGGISAQAIVLDQIREEYKKIITEHPPLPNMNIPIIEAKFRNLSNLYGALYPFFN